MKTTTELTLRFLRAAEHGRIDVANLLLIGGVDVEARGRMGESSLHSSAGSGQAQMIRYLLPLIGTLEVRDACGCTPLHWAARRHEVEVTELLLELGADTNAVDKHRQTALHSAVGGRTLDPGHFNVHSSDCQIAKLLVDGGAIVDAADDSGRTPLHLSAHDGNVEIVRLLIRMGAAIDATTVAGDTPLHLAAEGGHKEVIRLLIDAGAAINIVDAAGRTPLHRHVGAIRRRKDIVRLLLVSGADPNACDKHGRSVLDEAVRSNHRDPLAQLLRQHGSRE